jgi:hypothetical protein
MRFAVAAANATAIYKYDLVGVVSTGTVAPAAADCGDIMIGSVVGIYDSKGRAVGSPGSTTSTKYLPASTAGYVDVVPALPDVIFRVQCLSSTTPAATDVFSSSDHTAGTGSTATGISGHELTATFSTANMFKVIGKVDEPGNDWGEHVDVLVVAEESYWHDGTAGV